MSDTPNPADYLWHFQTPAQQEPVKTLRDELAMAALVVAREHATATYLDKPSIDDIAALAYLFADAMLSERAK